jgi:hypothetical protein
MHYATTITGGFFVQIPSIPLKVRGEFATLFPLKIDGDVVYRTQDLAMEHFDTSASGHLKVVLDENPVLPFSLPLLRIPGSVDLTVDIDPGMKLMDFPLSVEKMWGLPYMNITVDGEINSVWLRLLNFCYRLLAFFDIDIFPPEIEHVLPSIDISEILHMVLGISNPLTIPRIDFFFYCLRTENIDVPAGSFISYNITNLVYPDQGYFNYVPDIGKIARVTLKNDVIEEILTEDIMIVLTETNVA